MKDVLILVHTNILSAMTMVLAIGAVEPVFTIEEEDAIQAWLERSEHYLDKIEENFSIRFTLKLLPSTEEVCVITASSNNGRGWLYQRKQSA